MAIENTISKLDKHTILTKDTLPTDFFENSRNVGFLPQPGVNKRYLVEMRSTDTLWLEVEHANIANINGYFSRLEKTSAKPDHNVRFKVA